MVGKSLNLISWLEDHRFKCMFKEITGMECPGCGMQTAVIEILKGNFLEGILLFPALIPMFITIVLLGLHLKFKFGKGHIALIISFVATLAVMLGDYIFKYI